MLIKYIVFVCIYILLYEVNCIDKKQESKDVFVPTKEWQVVPKGQPIPKGLHVRINFATGLTEAKLLDENESAKKDQALTHIPDQYENLDDKAIKKSTLEESLKNIKSDEILKPDQIKNIKNKFKSYETMKKNLADLHLTPKIGSEVLQDMMRTFREETQNKNVNLKEIVRIIQDFRFLAHQYDNAIDFVTLNGFQEVIYTNLNSSTTNVRIEILRLLSSLVQNNPKVQIHALETGSVGVLLRILSTDPDVQVKKATATAVSCLLRRFPLAQLKFIEHGGVAIVASIFEKNYIEAQVKFATLMSDLLLEKRHAVEQAEFYQYKLVNLEGLLVLHNWCESLSKLLSNVLRVDPTDHDSIEKCLSAMFTFRDRCGAQYDAEILTSLQSTYSILVLSEAQLDAEDEFGNNIFYTNLHDLSGELLKSTAQTKPKTEL